MERKFWWWIGGSAILFTIVIGWLQWLKWQAFAYNGLDLGIYVQTIWSLAHGFGFANSIHDPSYLGDHLELWLVPLAGVYRFAESGLTLLWSQTVVIAISIWPLAALLKKKFGQRTAILGCIIFLAHPLVYNAAMYEFHGLVFALPLLFAAIHAYQRHRFFWFLVLMLLLLAVREDLPLLVFGWAGLAALERRKWQWWAIPALIAVVWFLGAQSIIRHAQPLGEYKYLAFYQWLGNTPGEIVTYPFRHPIVFIAHIFQARNWLTTLGFLMSFSFLPLAGWKKLLPVTLPYFQLMLIGAEADSILRLHYVVLYIPFLIWASFAGIERLKSFFQRWHLDQQAIRLGLVLVIVLGPMYGQLVYGAAEWPWTTRPDTGTTPAPILANALAQVPDSANVITTFDLLPQLASRKNIYSLNYVHLGRRQYTQSPYHIPTSVDYAVIDWQQFYQYQYLYRDTLFQGKTGAQRLEELLITNDLQLAWFHGGVAIYARDGRLQFGLTEGEPYAPVESKPAFPELVGSPTIVSQGSLPIDGVNWTEITLGLRWKQRGRPSQPLSLRFTLIDNGKAVWNDVRPINIGFPQNETWQPGEVWKTIQQLALPPDVAPVGTLNIELVSFSGRMRLDRWRSFSPVINKTERLQTLPSVSLTP